MIYNPLKGRVLEELTTYIEKYAKRPKGDDLMYRYIVRIRQGNRYSGNYDEYIGTFMKDDEDAFRLQQFLRERTGCRNISVWKEEPKNFVGR